MSIVITDPSELRPGDVANLTLIEDERVQHQTIVSGFDLNDSPPYILGRSDVQDRYPLTAWRLISATREVPEYAPGQAGTATVRQHDGEVSPNTRGLWIDRYGNPLFCDASGDFWPPEMVSTFVPDRAPRPLPLNGTVMVVLGSHELKDNGECLCGRLVSGHPYDIHVANDLIQLFAGPDIGHGDNCGDPSCDC
jgi:hypothetical protein